ncbi:glycoside hydrolase family 43 protein [uncultured Aquimarina sp.]|uniref:glycoside hydrolase family 43 protein n=1 Tax=uncultured Aquimarina sp. TaxID=575652 RepID=UPI002632A3C2|nr:glycoside hydrolase family 43 protein [uncultured Aquimarina sp.]
MNIRNLYVLFFVFVSSLGQAQNTYTNPILAGFYPDPSICKVEGSYYMITSTFAYFPGIPIFKSDDLVNWEQIGNVLDRPEQLDLDGLGVSRGIFAPAIRFKDGLYYITGTVVDGKNNFVVTASDPSGPWSDPVWIPEVNGIDPSMFFDTDGKAYIIYNSTAPSNKPLYDGHRTIKINEFDIHKLKVVSEQKILINGGADFSKKPIWIEGPHIFKKNGYYYLIAAEGGTAEGHSEVVFRSKDVLGPYESYDKNPILTQRHLNPNREFPVTSIGHVDIVETDHGDWFGVFLGCRPYDNDHYNTGRETFMAPIKWKDNWPMFDLGGDSVKYNYPTPSNVINESKGFQYSGNFSFKEDFDHTDLGYNWLFLRTPKDKWFEIKKGLIEIETRPESCSEKENPSFIGHRQQHSKGSVTVLMKFTAEKENEKSGLVIFQNESHYYYLCKSVKNKIPVLQLFRSSEITMEEIVSTPIFSENYVRLKIVANNDTYDFLYAEDQEDWKLLKSGIDAKFVSTKVAGGFVGAIYGMYTTSLGNKSNNSAVFDWFEYKGNDEMYKKKK